MNKSLRNKLILIVVLIIIGYFSYSFLNNQKEGTEENILQIKNIADNFSNIQEPHWTHMPITYRIINTSDECGRWQLERINKSIEEISNLTNQLVTFKETNNENVDLLFICKPSYIENNESYGYISITEAVSNINIDGKYIKNNSIIFYTSLEYFRYGFSGCSRPVVEIHEILHALGFEHVSLSERESIMNPEFKMCIFESDTGVPIDKEVISCLKKIYSNNQINGSCDNIDFVGYCRKGYIYEDNRCHQPCGKDKYCPDDSLCCNNTCYSCPVGCYLESDCNCYKTSFSQAGFNLSSLQSLGDYTRC